METQQEQIDAQGEQIQMLIEALKALPECTCTEDLNKDGLVDGADLTQLLGAWGVCP